MPANIERRKNLKQKQIEESSHGDFSLIGLAEQIESEIRWVQLHQTFDR
tara:strand:- start:238 stop:384 length:147 start_codon:yes stop_codon:yes gene_type:complete